MNNRLIKMATVAITLLALVGCGAAKTAIEEKAGNAPGKTVGQLQNPEGDGGTKTDIDECMKGCAMLSGTGMFSKQFCTDSCWASVAQDTGDVSICDTKIDQTNDLVLFACYLNVAEKTKDPKYCDKIGKDSSDFMRGGCYGNTAKLAKDPAMCEKIKGNMMYDSCVSDAKGE